MNTHAQVSRLLAASLLLCCAHTAFAGTVYVRQGATGTGGLSWGDAFGDLQAALDAAAVGDEIWVVAGTYKPTTTTDRTKSFALKSSSKLYGGFAGTETLLSERDIVANRTILSGDIGAGNADSYHVLRADLISNAVVSGFTITSGYADGAGIDGLGGGLYCVGGTGTLIEDCDFVQNYAQGGGGVYCKSSELTIRSCLFTLNTADRSLTKPGGGLYIVGADVAPAAFPPLVANCVFRGNNAYDGGAVFNNGNDTGTTTAFVNCTIYGNDAMNGGGISNSHAATPILTNCIIYGNTASGSGPQIMNWTPAIDVPAIDHCDIQGGVAGLGADGGGNIAVDPQFVNANPAVANLRLRSSSPCVNAGVMGTGAPATDKDGKPRPYAATAADIGAYEYQGTGAYRFYVKAGATRDGSSWIQAAGDLAATLQGAGNDDEVWVAIGTYSPGGAPANTFQLKPALKLFGSFAGTETLLTDRTWSTPPRPPSILSGAAGNNNHVVTGASGATIDGFTITGGNANGGGAADYGAGLFCGAPGGIITVLNCAFLSNSATAKGGALFADGYNPTLTNCVFWANRAVGAGGAVCTSNGNLAMMNCTVSGGPSQASGVSVGAGGATVTITNSIIWDTPPDAALVVAPVRTTTMTYTDCVAWRPGVGNFSQDPVFRDAVTGDLRLGDGSPCVNTGVTVGAPATDKDLMNVARPQGPRFDIGAYERPYATVTLDNLTQTYDGTAKTITATAQRADTTSLNVGVVYDGAHTDAGAYVVTATINDPDYSGSRTGSLQINKASASVNLKTSDLTTTYNGLPKSVAATTAPTGLETVTVTYGGDTTPPSLAGSYLVNATLTSNANYADAFTSGTLTINKAFARINLESPIVVAYDGNPKSILFSTIPSGVSSNVTITYDGLLTRPTDVGSYNIVAILSDPNYDALPAMGMLTIQPIAASVALSNLAQTYDGTAKPATVTATRSDTGAELPATSVSVTYDGKPEAPSAAGSYDVVAVVTDPNYLRASTEGVLAIGKADATIVLNSADLTRTYDGAAKTVRFTTTPAGVSTSVSVTYDGLSAAPTGAGSYNVVATLFDPNYAAPDAAGTLVINPVAVTVTLGNLSQPYDGSPKPVTANAIRADNGVALPASDVSITYNGSATAPSTSGSYAVVAAVTNPNFSGADAQGVLLINTPPAVAPSASPGTGTVPLAVTLSANAKDDNGDPLTYSWNFGDGSAASTEQAPVHTFTAAGTYEVSVTVNDGKGGTATAKTTVTVVNTSETVPGAADSDGDGFSNEIETALGSDPNNAGSTPGKLATPTKVMTLSAPKMSIKLNFIKTLSDSISLSSVLLVNDGYKPAGQTVIVDVGGVVKSFSLAGKGGVKNGGDSFALRIKLGKDGAAPLQVSKFTTKMTKGKFATQLGEYGLKTASGSPTVPVTVIFDGQLYQRAVKMTYKATSKSGSAK